MNIKELEKLQSEGTEKVTSSERRRFLKAGLAITCVFLGGSVLSLTSTRNAHGALGSMPEEAKKFPSSPHYSMVIRQNNCIDCERCKEACVATNHVPSYGYRTTILETQREIGPKETERIFVPVLCNHCNRPPCVRVCPTKATYKDKTTGIIVLKMRSLLSRRLACLSLPAGRQAVGRSDIFPKKDSEQAGVAYVPLSYPLAGLSS